jgi:hypothetical protein
MFIELNVPQIYLKYHLTTISRALVASSASASPSISAWLSVCSIRESAVLTGVVSTVCHHGPVPREFWSPNSFHQRLFRYRIVFDREASEISIIRDLFIIF